MVDEDLKILFSEDEEEVVRGVRALIARCQVEADLEERLVDLLETSLEHQNDDSSASVWVTVILGEIGSAGALSTLQRSLASDDDEMLQDAAQVALLRIGAPAIEAVMETVEDDSGLVFRRAAYTLLGTVGVLEDEALRQRVADFLEARVEPERRKPLGERAVEEIFQATAQLGMRRHLSLMRKVLREDYHGHNNLIQDALERLEENVDGVAFVGSSPPWEERYASIIRDERQGARVSRTSSGKITVEPGPAPAGAAGEEEGSGGAGKGMAHKRQERQTRVSRLMRGLSMVDGDEAEEDSKDSR
jgi:hypothetical protein